MKETEKWRYFNDVRLLSRIIRTNLESKDFEKLEDSLDEGFKKLPKTKYYQKILISGTILLANHYIDQVQLFDGLNRLETARQSFPRNRKIVKNEISLIESIFDLYYSEFVKRDIILFENIILILSHIYSKGFPQESKKLYNLIDRKNYLKDQVRDDIESGYTFRLEEFLLILYGNLTREEQQEEMADILTPEILKWIAQLDENDDKNESTDNNDDTED